LEAYPIVDAVSRTSWKVNQAALERIAPAGARLASWAQLARKRQRD